MDSNRFQTLLTHYREIVKFLHCLEWCDDVEWGGGGGGGGRRGKVFRILCWGNFNRDCSSSRENFQRFTATQQNIKVSSRLIEMSRIKIQFAIKFKESIFYKKMLQLLQLLPLSERIWFNWNHFRSRLCFACLWKKHNCVNCKFLFVEFKYNLDVFDFLASCYRNRFMRAH